MNTEPPTGDELQRMLVSMKQTVLDRADEVRPRPVRRRHVGLAIGLAGLLVVGTASGAFALGLVPHDLFAAPAASPTPTSSPRTEASAPETATTSTVPTPTPTATPSSSRRPFAADDPGTWTISSTEVGPIALGAPYDGEIDDLPTAYTRDPNENCPNPTVSFWDREGSAPLVVSETNGVVTGVSVGLAASTDPALLATSPTTAKGIGDGSTLDELKAAYPGIALIGNANGQPDGTGVFDLWSLRDGAHSITFELGDDGVHVGLVWVGSDPRPPAEYCG